MSTDRPSSPERPSHEEFLKELAALDEALRRPDEPARPPIQSSHPIKPPDSIRPPDPIRLRDSIRPHDSIKSRDSIGPRDLRRPRDVGFDEPHELILPPRAAVALREPGDASGLSQRHRLVGLFVVALGGGLLAGGAFGVWLATSPFDSGTPAETVARALSVDAPIASRSVRPSTRARTAAPIAAARTPVASVSAERSVVLPPSLPAAPSSDWIAAAAPTVMTELMAPPPAIASHAGIPSTTTVPISLIDAPSRVSPAMAMVAADEAAIEATLRRYEQAYERLDAKAAVAVWPTVDRRALSRAFAGLTSQALDMRGCEVVVRAGASTATASCHGSAEYVRKVGDARVHVEPRQWTFTLNKTEGEWRIDAVDGQR